MDIKSLFAESKKSKKPYVSFPRGIVAYHIIVMAKLLEDEGMTQYQRNKLLLELLPEIEQSGIGISNYLTRLRQEAQTLGLILKESGLKIVSK